MYITLKKKKKKKKKGKVVPVTIHGGPGSIPGATRFSEK
jgi:hypothetical protein